MYMGFENKWDFLVYCKKKKKGPILTDCSDYLSHSLLKPTWTGTLSAFAFW